MRTPPEAELYAPEFPQGIEWVNVAFLRIQQLARRTCVLVEFWDFARINSLRTLPYLRAWHERYAERGLRVIGVHSPGYSFGRDADTVRRAVERLDIPYAVALDPAFVVWREYGNKGWPGRYLFGPDMRLRYIHYGEGDYLDCELAIQEALRDLDPGAGDLPAPLDPVRPEDAPGVMLAPQTADIRLPDERDRLELVRDWTDGPDYIEAADAGAGATARFEAGTAYAVLSGAVPLGDGEPGLYEVPDGTVIAEAPGLRLHGFQFTPRAAPGA